MSETAQFEVPVSTMAQGNAGLGCSQCTFGKELGQRTEQLVVGAMRTRAKTLSILAHGKAVTVGSVYIRSSLVSRSRTVKIGVTSFD